MIFFMPSQSHPSQAVPPCGLVTENSNVSQPTTMKPLEAIRCTHPSCPCECFAPGKQSLRYCDSCSHGWVAHALDKLGTNHVMNLGLQVEVVQPNIVFDIASLMLYGAHATPVRLKILLDRLFSVLQHEEVLQVLHGFGWTYEDYARGYILQDSAGRVLDKWCVATREEEMVILQQFLRFGETKAIAQEIILQDTKDRHEVLAKQTSRAESDIKKFIERSNMSMQSYIKSYESSRQLFATRPFIPPPGTRIMTTPLISPTYSPNRDTRAITLPQQPTASNTPLATPPLSRLQIMQPFDARKEHPVIPHSPAILDKVSARRSPVCESPKNLSTTPSTVSSAAASPSHQPLHLQQQQMLHQQQQQQLQQQQQQQQALDEVDGSDPYASGSDDDGEVLDYSVKDNPDSPSDPDRKNKQHMRKSSNPIKRQWTPSANFGSTFVGPNGKKRVLCTACNKTFCDKGALKIHYSAVHLKEMHKCTVEGCNMMFSSRRSRNRHSANPNPKLHMPQKRKEDMDPSDDMDLSASNGSGRVTPVATSTPTLSVPNTSPINPAQVLTILDTPRIIRPDQTSFYIEMSAQFPFMSPPEKKIKLEEDQPTDLSQVNNTRLSPAEEPCDLSKKFDGEMKLEIDLDACNDHKDMKKDEDVEAEESGSKNESGVRGGKRRKNTAPTRCAQSGEVASDDNSDDKDPKSGSPPDPVKDVVVTYQGTRLIESSSSHNSVETGQRQVCHGIKHNEEAVDGQPIDSNTGHAIDKLQEATGAKKFPKMASLLWAVNMDNPHGAESIDDEGTTRHSWSSKDAKDPEDDQEAVCDDEEDDDEGSDSSGESSDVMQDYPPEVYVDKENPLQCKICGKVFQNSFTVKIHFQNVHLKLMHSCTVDGCLATFPSKRSRDRHSANINLHRRLLPGDGQTDEEMDDALRGNILVRLYGRDLVGASMASQNGRATLNGEKERHSNNNNIDEQVSCGSTLSKSAVQPSDTINRTIQHGLNSHVSKPGSAGSEALSDSEGEDKEDFIDSQLMKIACTTCGENFTKPLVLQEHIAISHPDHALMTYDPVILRKSVSPRRSQSRQKIRNGMVTRKNTSF